MASTKPSWERALEELGASCDQVYRGDPASTLQAVRRYYYRRPRGRWWWEAAAASLVILVVAAAVLHRTLDRTAGAARDRTLPISGTWSPSPVPRTVHGMALSVSPEGDVVYGLPLFNSVQGTGGLDKAVGLWNPRTGARASLFHSSRNWVIETAMADRGWAVAFETYGPSWIPPCCLSTPWRIVALDRANGVRWTVAAAGTNQGFSYVGQVGQFSLAGNFVAWTALVPTASGWKAEVMALHLTTPPALSTPPPDSHVMASVSPVSAWGFADPAVNARGTRVAFTLLHARGGHLPLARRTILVSLPAGRRIASWPGAGSPSFGAAGRTLAMIAGDGSVDLVSDRNGTLVARIPPENRSGTLRSAPLVGTDFITWVRSGLAAAGIVRPFHRWLLIPRSSYKGILLNTLTGGATLAWTSQAGNGEPVVHAAVGLLAEPAPPTPLPPGFWKAAGRAARFRDYPRAVGSRPCPIPGGYPDLHGPEVSVGTCTTAIVSTAAYRQLATEAGRVIRTPGGRLPAAAVVLSRWYWNPGGRVVTRMWLVALNGGGRVVGIASAGSP